MYVGHDSCMCTYSIDKVITVYASCMYVGHDSCMWDMTHVCGTRLMYVGHDSCMWDMTHVCGT